MKHYQYIIIGQGLAGTVLSMQMQEMGVNHLVIDKPELSASSKIAAGLANPIVLKRLKWVKDAELFMPELDAFYRHWENKLKITFWHSISLNHVFHDTEEVNHWMAKSEAPNFRNHLGPVSKSNNSTIMAPFGTGRLENIAWLDTEAFLKSYRQFLIDKEQYLDMNLGNKPETKLKATGLSANHIIYCTGHRLRSHFFHTEKLFTPTRGEVMVLGNTAIEQAWHKAIFALPLGNNKVKIGATYAHDILEDASTEKGAKFLLEKLHQFYSGPYKILSHHGGVRPNIADRKPILGEIEPGKFVFNGMGSRAVLLAPYLSKLMTSYLLGNTSIPARWNIKRFTLS